MAENCHTIKKYISVMSVDENCHTVVSVNGKKHNHAFKKIKMADSKRKQEKLECGKLEQSLKEKKAKKNNIVNKNSKGDSTHVDVGSAILSAK